MCGRLLVVLMKESPLCLVFEFLSMDLRKYLDSLPSGEYVGTMLVKVRRGEPFVTTGS